MDKDQIIIELKAEINRLHGCLEDLAATCIDFVKLSAELAAENKELNNG
jgi:hypothetical protein